MKRPAKLLFVVPFLAGIGDIMAEQPRSIGEPTPARQLRYVRQEEDIPLPPPPVVIEGQGPLQAASAPEVLDCDCCEEMQTGGAKHPRWQRTKSCLQYSHWGYADQFYARPFGTYVRSAVGAHASNGIAAQLTLYRYDFVDVTGIVSTKLNSHGRIRLVRMAGTLSSCPYPLNIEYDQDHPQANEARRQHVLAQLKLIMGDVADEQVVVRIPAVRGRDAEEGLLLYQNLLQQVQQGPTSSTSNGVQGGSTSGSSASAAVSTGTR